jgi:predicted amidohydrolase YtcJ
LYNGHFVTFKKGMPHLDAVLIRNGVIEKCYARKSIAPHRVRRINLKNRFVIPGFIDSHTHLIGRGIELQRIDLETCRSLAACLDKMRSGLHTEHEVIFGSNWDETAWHSRDYRQLTRHTLDAISRKRPVIMRRICGHFAVVNTCALQRIPHTWRVVDRKNGHLYEDVALNLDEVFKPSDGMLARAIDLGTAEALRAGITSVQEITKPRRFRFLQRAKARRKLKLRWACYITSQYLDSVVAAGLTNGFGDDFLKFCGVKVFLDGSVGARTAAVSRPYAGTRNHGTLLFSERQLLGIARTAQQHDLQLMIHAIGDRASARAVRVLTQTGNTQNQLRHRIEHLEIADTRTIKTMARYKLIASMQPNFTVRWQQPRNLYEQYLGDRYREMNCFRQFAAAGVNVIFGSDCMPLGPLYGLQGAIFHPFTCGQCTPLQALKMYTETPAYATFDEKKKGHIAEGMLADLVVLDKNPLVKGNYGCINVLMTMVNGDIVYTRRV